MNVFIVGPGGVGKSASGIILADLLKFRFVDLDTEFCDSVGNIGQYLATHHYAAYCIANSDLLGSLLSKTSEHTVFVLSSGFLVHEECPEIAVRNLEMIKDAGVTILLLPSNRMDECAEIVVRRQMQRGFGLHEGTERQKYQSRHNRYLAYGDIQIFSESTPESIAEQMRAALLSYLPIVI